MPKVTTEAHRICPELIEAVKLIDDLSYTRQYAEVFEDLVDWMVWQHQFPPNEANPIAKYSDKEQEQFLSIFKVVQEEVKKRSNLWSEQKSDQNWYDPMGRLYECITSKNKSSRLGQYFTPKHVVNMMVQMQMGDSEKDFITMLDPACGSGRMGLAAATQSMIKGTAIWVTMNDIDPICSKMTAANMCLNGIVGEALCCDGLDIKGDSYRFGYRVEPMLAQVPNEMQQIYRMAMLSKTGQDVQKQYVIKPVAYEQTYLKQVNDRYLQELGERQKIGTSRLIVGMEKKDYLGQMELTNFYEELLGITLPWQVEGVEIHQHTQ
ncbi:MAG: N-6 DNA methylase, partial [Bacteroidota bacterium]